jgi:hypothetical protein
MPAESTTTGGVTGTPMMHVYPIQRCLLLARCRDAEYFALSRAEGNHDDIVLILPICRLSFAGENADDAQRHAFDLQNGAERPLAGSEQLTIDRLPNHGD